MEDIKKNILLAIYKCFEQNQKGTGDEEISEAFKIDIDQVRVYLKDLQRKGYIKLIDAGSHKNPERMVVGSITSEGRLISKRELLLDKKIKGC